MTDPAPSPPDDGAAAPLSVPPDALLDAGVQHPPSSTPANPAPDRWAHRRAEPRTFAFIWTMYLFLATVSTYAITVTSGVGGYDVIRPAARGLLALIAAGIVIVWPMVRFTQVSDQRPIAGPILDLIVVLVPLQAIIWPQHAWWLTGWPLRVVAAVAAFTGAWASIVAAVLAGSHSLRRQRSSPALWMTGVLALLLASHIPMVINAAFAAHPVESSSFPVRPTWLLSPIAGVYELTRDRTWTGLVAEVFPGHWRVIGLLWGISVALWLLAAGFRMRIRRESA